MKPFMPDKLPIKSIDWSSLVKLIGKANATLARYDGLLQGMVNPEILLSPFTYQEAVLSSKIEGTQATLGEVLKQEAGEKFDDKRGEDIREVINYRTAMFKAEKILQKYPINLNMIKEIHKVLLKDVRGRNQGLGSFRQVQNWIGKKGCSIEKASYVPPEPMYIMEFLDNWEKYIHSDEKDLLVQLSIIHAQFEIIHPFLDGNGRIGRIIIPLFLYEKKILIRPMFYLSAFLESNRDRYYTSLRNITKKNDWQGWIKFFLEAIIFQANENNKKTKRILELYEKMKIKIPKITHSQYALSALDCLFYRPIFNTSSFIRESKIPKQTAILLLQKLRKNGIINIIRKSRGRKPGIYIFDELFDIAEG